MKKKMIMAPIAMVLLLASCQGNTSSSEAETSSSLEESSSQITESLSSEESSSSEDLSSKSSSPVDESKVANVKFIVKTVNVDLNSTAQLQWKIYPSTAKNTNVSFSVADTSVATVSSDGVVSGLSVGQTTVMIKTEDGDFTDTATINVIGQQATGIKLVLPEGTLQESNGTYLLKVGQSIQLSYVMEPSSSVNSITYSSEAPSYLYVSKSGYLTAKKLKTEVKITVTTDNYFYDTVTISVVKDSIYANYALKNKLSKSTSIEKEKVVSGTKKITHIKPKTSVDEVTNETFNIYTNGVAREYSLKDNYLNKTTNYDGFYGIYNGKFYQIERKGSAYSSTSVTNIGTGEKDITQDKAEEQSSLMYYRTRYGMAEIINGEYLSSSTYFGRTGDWQTYTYAEKKNTLKIDATYEQTSSYYLVSSTYNVLSLEITLADDGMVTSYKFTCYSYDSNSYDFTNHALKDGASPIETVIHEFSQVAGERSAASSFVLEPSQCYFTSLDVEVYDQTSQSTSLTVGDYIKFKAVNYLPSTATSSIDAIEYVSSSNENVVKNTNGGLRALGEGNATLTFRTSGGLTVTSEVSVSYATLTSLTISTSAIGVKVGGSMAGITVDVAPSNANPAATLEIIDGEENATLTYDETKKTYSLTGVAEGKVTLKATSTVDSSISTTKTLYVYEEIAEDEVLATLLANKYRTTASNDYTLVFLENGKGRICLNDDLEGFISTFEYGVDGYTVKVSNYKSLASTNGIYALENLTLDKNGLEIVGKMQTSSSTYSKREYTFTLYE